MSCGTDHRKVLIVNSDPYKAEAISSRINCCFDTEMAGTMREALSKLNNGGIVSCIVIDPVLPNGQGVGLIERLRKLFPQIPLLIVLSLGTAPAEEYREAGMNHVVSAPFNPERIQRELFNCVARNEADRAVAPLREEAQAIRSTVTHNSAIIKQASNL